MEQQGNDSLFGVINKPPSFSGRKCDLEGFLTRAELAMESRPNQFHDDSAKVRFLMSYMLGKPLEWVSLLRKNNSPLLNNYDDFVKELKSNFGDYTTQAVVANSKLCSLRQRKSGFVFEYIAEFQRIAQYSDFNESAKIYMFIKGLKHSLREKLAIVDPNPRSLERLTTTILNIESLLKRNEKIEYYEQATPHDDPMEIDLYRIKRGPNDIKYRARTKNYTNNEKNYNEEKRKGICYYCKQSGHMSFNCPNKIKPKNLRVVRKGKEPEDDEYSNMRRIKKLRRSQVFDESVGANNSESKTNIMDFYLKTNGTEEGKVKVLIDSGSDLNFIHPDAVKKLGIKTKSISKPFSVSGLGFGVSKVYEETEKCIMRFKNHMEIIQLFVLRIPDVDVILGLPWIEKHSPSNYHNVNKISFSSGYCARHCNNGKRQRRSKKKTKKVNKMELLEKELAKSEGKFANDEPSCSSEYKPTKYTWDSSSDAESEPEPYFKGRFVHTINDENDSDSDTEDRFMFDSISDSEFENNIVSDSDSKYLNDSCNKTNSCIEKKNLNKDENLVKVPIIYLDYKEVFNEKNCNVLPPHRVYDCEINLKDNSILFYGPLYPLTELERDELKKQLKELLDKGFIRKSTSPAGAPVLFVRKKDGTLRLVIDYRKLNEMTIRNSYPLPLISELLDRVKGAKVFTKLDLKSAYNLVRIKEGDEYKTAFRTRYGHFEFLVMPFGLKNAPATFQHFINDVLGDYLDDFVISYIDDILIFSNSIEEHHIHVKKVLKRLLENNLVVKLEKCEFDKSETTFLGYVISKEGLKMDTEKVKAILDWPAPTNVKEVQSFIGLCNYYRLFIKDFAKIANPIHKLTRKNVPFVWGKDQQKAFDKLKHLFTSAPILRNPDSNKPFIVETDASNFAVGAVLSQEFDGKLHPVAFLSKSLTKCQRNYQIYDKELLAIKLALEERRHYLEGARHQFIVYTDHKNLTFPRKPEMLSQRQIRWYEFLSRFDFKLIYRAGKKSGKPDLLSRRSDHLFANLRTVSKCCLKISNKSDNSLINSILISLNDDELFLKIRTYLNDNSSSSPPIKNINKAKIDDEGFLLIDNLIYVPKSLRTKVMEIHHDSISAGHFGIKKTTELISRNFWWPKLITDVTSFIRSCDICCRNKISRHKPYGLLSPLSTPNKPWSNISMDFIVDLPKSRDLTCIMVVVDRLTKMAHFIPFRCLPTASIAADAFLTYIFRLHGLPESIISDRGSQFTSAFWSRLCSLYDIEHSLSTANHPQTDGQTERVNAILEQYLRCFINERQNNWADLLPFAEFSYNNSLQQSINQTPFFANYGFNPKAHPEIPSNLRPNRAEKRVVDINENIKLLKENLNKAKETYKRYADQKRMNPPKFEVGDKVWLLKGINTKNRKKKLSNPMIGPFKIIKKVSNLAYELDLPKKMRCHPVFHVSLLEPYFENEFLDRSNRKRKNIKLSPDYSERIPEKINDMKVIQGKKFYCVSWKNSNLDHSSWIEENQIPDKQLIQEYERRIRKGKQPDNDENEYYNNSEYYVRHKYQPFTIDIPSRNS